MNSLEDAAKNLALSEVLVKILRLAAKRSLPCVPLRGVVLAEQLYGHLTHRPTGDIDLLVQKQNLPAVRDLMEELGFTEIDIRPGWALEFDYTLEFFKDGVFPIIVEPHWSIAYPPLTDRIPQEAVWSRMREATFLNTPTKLLAPEHLLIHLCLHIFHHDQEAPLLWFSDIDRLIRSPSQAPNWPLFLQDVQEAGLAPLIAPALLRTAQIFQTPISKTILETLAKFPISADEKRIFDILAKAPGIYSRERLATLAALPGPRAKFRYASSLLFPAKDFMKIHYGTSSAWGLWSAYLRRFCFLVWKGLSGQIWVRVPWRLE